MNNNTIGIRIVLFESFLIFDSNKRFSICNHFDSIRYLLYWNYLTFQILLDISKLGQEIASSNIEAYQYKILKGNFQDSLHSTFYFLTYEYFDKY